MPPDKTGVRFEEAALKLAGPAPLGAIAQRANMRRKVSERLGGAPKLVGMYAEHLARIGAEPDPAVAKALGITEREVVQARVALAAIFRHAEDR